MKPKSELSIKLYNNMIKAGYPEGFADVVSQNLNTDFTAKRMIGYLSHQKGLLPLEEVADEMLAILSDRNAIMAKKDLEYNNALWNEHLERGISDSDDDW